METRAEFVPGTDRILPLDGRRDRMSAWNLLSILIVALWETSEIVSESGGGFTSLIAYVSAGLF